MAGMGLAFISLHTILLEHQTGNLVLLDLQGLPVVRNWYVLHRASKQLGPTATAFKQFLHAEAPAYMAALQPLSRPARRAAGAKSTR